MSTGKFQHLKAGIIDSCHDMRSAVKFNSLFFLLWLLVVEAAWGQLQDPLSDNNQVVRQQQWVDSIYQSFSIEQKIGQLFMVDVFSRDDLARRDKVDQLIKQYHLGGIIFSKGTPSRQAEWTNHFQAVSAVPLMIAMDAEWGLAMRLDSTFAYPWNMTLGAIQDLETIQAVGERIGMHCKRLGVHINFAPVVDLNTNPKNPIIGNRSFGSEQQRVTDQSIAFMTGMQRQGVLANAKHFPGHGDTDKDSHKTLPTVNFDRTRLNAVELFPYPQLFSAGLASVMVAHLNVPELTKKRGRPTSVSREVVQELLQNEMGFQGLIFTDALNMKGASEYKNPGDIEWAALSAGNDVLLIPEDVPQAVARLLKAYQKGQLTEARLSHSVKKILKAKFLVGLHRYQPISLKGLTEDLNAPQDQVLYDQCMAQAITVLKNKEAFLPIRELGQKRVAYVSFGDSSGTPFLTALNGFAEVDQISAPTLDALLMMLEDYDLVIAGVHKSNETPWKNHKINDKTLVWLYEISRKHQMILSLFAKPYALNDFATLSNIEGIVVAYQNSVPAQNMAAEILFGARGALGRLPVALKEFPVLSGEQTTALKRLQRGVPESVGLSSQGLKRIDSLLAVGLNKGMFPGAQVIVARNGRVVYDRSVGFHTYDSLLPVKSSDVYDVASLTKILATLPLVMQEVDQGHLSLKAQLGDILPELATTNKDTLSLMKVLSHYAGLQSWIPFYKSTLDSVTQLRKPELFQTQKSDSFGLKVADDLYLRSTYTDSIFEAIAQSELLPTPMYKYSDLPFYLLKLYLERRQQKSLAELSQTTLYRSLGAWTMGYLPQERFDLNQIIPSEIDDYFRDQRIHGDVHDPGAAMLGGVGGHAGLFSNALDVAKLMQMYLWEGTYGGTQYVRPETINAFNTCYFCEDDVRRGVGFDKPQLEDEGPTCGCVSMTSFGHSGFTGTFAWADPEEEIVYVFLSNRTYPTAENRSLISSNLRTEIQAAIYASIIKIQPL